MKKQHQGSEEWFQEIAREFGDGLLGIELHTKHRREIAFIVKFDYEKTQVPRSIAQAEGYNGDDGVWIRGKNKRTVVTAVLFNFPPPRRLPSKAVTKKVGREFRLTTREEKVWSNVYFGLYLPSL